MGVLKKVGRVLLDLVVVTVILVMVPGLPPYNMTFEAFSITPPRELTGKLEPNTRLDRATPILEGEILGPESIAVRGQEVYSGLIGGNVIRYKNGKAEVVARFGSDCEGKWEEAKCGRPLGMRFSPVDGKLIVVDAYYGLFSVDVDTGAVKNLVSSNTTIDGIPPMILNDLDVARDGSIYFSDSSAHSHLSDSADEFLGNPSGRLLRYNPKTKKTEVLLKELHFANGVQLSKNEDFVLVSESARSRVMKYHLKGAKQGTSEIFIDGLPGSPDNIRSNGRGGMYICLVAVKYSDKLNLMDGISPLPYLRKFILRVMHLVKIMLNGINFALPNEYTAKAAYYVGHLEPLAQMLPKHTIIVEVDREGNIIQSLHGRTKVLHISEITLDADGKFAYLGSPYNKQIWKISAKDLETAERKIVEMNLG